MREQEELSAHISVEKQSRDHTGDGMCLLSPPIPTLWLTSSAKSPAFSPSQTGPPSWDKPFKHRSPQITLLSYLLLRTLSETCAFETFSLFPK